MPEQFSRLGRCVSIFGRLMKMYYDRNLAEFEIGWGQQFYIEYLYEHPGATPQEMAERIRVDKATLTKTIKKLSAVGYLQVVGDRQDRRVKHLYLTEAAQPAARRIKAIHAAFYEDLCAGIPPEDLAVAERTLEQAIENINRKVWHRMEDPHGTQ